MRTVPLDPRSLTDEDLADLIRLATRMYDGTSGKDILDRVISGQYQLWRAGKAIILAEVIERPQGKELLIWGLIGKDFAKIMTEVGHEFESIAKACGCRWISTWASRPAMVRFCHRFGGTKIAEVWVKEIE